MPTKEYYQDLIKSYSELTKVAVDRTAATSLALNMTPEDFARMSHARCVDMLSKNSPDYEVSPYWAARKFELELSYPELFTQPANHINPITKKE